MDAHLQRGLEWVALAVVMVLSGAWFGASALAAPARWIIVPARLPGATGITAAGRSSIWAFDGFQQHWSTAMRWTASGWRAYRTSPQLGTDGVLADGVAFTSSDVWAVGRTGRTPHGLIARWDGRVWRYYGRLSVASNLLAVGRVPGTQRLWAVGYRLSNGTRIPLVEHRYAGWRRSATPTVPGGGFLSGVASNSPTETWAVGHQGPASAPGAALVERWSGATWRLSSVPNPTGVTLNAVAAVPGTNRAIAVGLRQGNGFSPAAYDWSGSRWYSMPIGSLVVGDARFIGVVSIRPGYAWAVGSIGTSALVARWTLGPSWRRWPVPKLPPQNCTLASLQAIADVPRTAGPTLWAVGTICGNATLAMHYR